MARYDIYSGRISSGLTLYYDSMYIYSGGVANSTTMSGDYMYISGGSMYIYSGGVANSTTVSYGGWMFISSGGVANSTTVSSGGGMIISSGGTATNVIWTPCVGNVVAHEGAYVTYASKYSGVYFGSNNQLLSHTQSMTGKVVSGYNCSIYVMSSGVANSTTVYSSGYMYIFSGGVANSTTVSGGWMSISSGGTATNVIWTPCIGCVSAHDGAYVTYASKYSGVYFGSNDQLLSHTQSMTGKVVSGYNCSMYVMSSGVANSTTVYSGGYMNIFSGGVANSTTINDRGRMYISSDGVANSTTVYSSGCMYINSGGVANSTTVYSSGYMNIFSGGVANSTTINEWGHMYIDSGGVANSTTVSSGYMHIGGVANSTTVSGGWMSISNGGVANSTTMSSGYMYISSGGVANSTTINSGGRMSISSGGVANSTTMSSGYMYIYSGGVANGTTVSSGGYMYIDSDGTHRGTLQIENGAVVSAYSEAEIDFTVAGRKSSSNYLINNLSQIQGAPTYTITVENNQEYGTYKLAQDASDFTGTLTIGDGTVDYGSITVNGEDFVYQGAAYSLDQDNGNLTLTISKAANKIVDGDLDGNGKADVLLVHSKQGFSGTWFVTGGTPAIEWGNLSTIGKNVELIGVGNVYNSTDSNDIFLKNGSTIAAWVMEDGKVKSYKGLYNINSNMNFLGLGDFNGDGATDYLLRSKGGDLGFISSNDNKWHYFKGLGSEWKIAAIGDLNGDGLDDVVLRHDAGFAGTYLTQENGSVKWANLDTLKNDMTIIGTGDFNGDGVDDVLLQKNTGWVGAWLVKDGSVKDFMGICTTKTSIEQIADFNGDGIDDLRVRTDAGDLGIRYVYGADNTSWKYLKSVGDEWETQFSALA